jgi:hypothetical protein
MASDSLGGMREVAARFRTLTMSSTASYDTMALARAMRRAGAARGSGGPDGIRSSSAPTFGGDDAWVRHTWHMWWRPPSLWRDDLTWPNGATTVSIVQPDVAQAYVSLQRTLYTSAPASIAGAHGVTSFADGMQLPTVAGRLAEFPLVRPPLPASEWALTTLGHEVYIGRQARRTRAVRRSETGRSNAGNDSGYWLGVDEYECLVDVTIGITLRFTGLIDGAPAAILAADEVHVDTSLPSDVFAFAPPAGTRIVHVTRSM